MFVTELVSGRVPLMALSDQHTLSPMHTSSLSRFHSTVPGLSSSTSTAAAATRPTTHEVHDFEVTLRSWANEPHASQEKRGLAAERIADAYKTNAPI